MHGLTGEPKLAVGVSVSVNNSLSLSLYVGYIGDPSRVYSPTAGIAFSPTTILNQWSWRKWRGGWILYNTGIMKRSKSGKAGSHSMQTLGIVWHCCISSSFVVKSIYVHYLVPLPLKKELSEMSIEKMKGQFTSWIHGRPSKSGWAPLCSTAPVYSSY